MANNQKKLKIYGKNRVIRNIVTDEENEFEAYYKNHWMKIEIKTEERLRRGEYVDVTTCYIWSTAPDGSYIYDGYGHHRDGIRYGEPFTIEEAISAAMENILYEEKEK